MATISERLQFLVELNSQGAISGFQRLEQQSKTSLDQAEQKLDRTGQSMVRFGTGAIATGAIVGLGLAKAGQAAGDLGEAMSATDQVFGESADAIHEWAAQGAADFGLSQREAEAAAQGFGILGEKMGQSAPEAATFSQTMVELAGDMASFKNTRPEDAVLALSQALRGEAEGIRQYGVLLDDATLKNRALQMGLIESTTGTLPPAIRAQAAYAEVLAQTSTIQGDFDRTSDSLANRQRILAADMENLKATIGAGVLPVLQDLVGVGLKVTGFFNDLPGPVQEGVSKFAVFATGALVVGGALTAVTGKLIQMRNTLLPMVTRTLPDGSRELNKLGRVAGGVAVVGALAAATGGLLELGGAMDKLQVKVEDLGGATNDELVEAFERVSEVGNLGGEMLESFAQQGEAGIGMLTRLAEALEKEGKDASDVRAKLEDLKTTTQALTVASSEGAAVQDEWKASAEGSAEAAVALAKAEAEAAEVSGKLRGAVLEVTREFDEVTNAADAYEDALDGVIGNSVDAQQAALDYADHVADLTEKAKELRKDGLDPATQAGRDNQRMLLDSVEAAASYSQTVYNQTGSVEAASVVLSGHAEKLREVMREAGMSELAIEEMIAQLNLTPADITTTVQLQGDIAARERIAAHIEEIRKIDPVKATEIQTLVDQGKYAEADREIEHLARPRRVDLRVNAVSDRSAHEAAVAAAAAAAPQQRALGGHVQAGNVYQVNEPEGGPAAEVYRTGDGRQYVVPGHDGYIAPAAAATPSQVVYNQTVNVYPAKEQLTEADLRRILRYQRLMEPSR